MSKPSTWKRGREREQATAYIVGIGFVKVGNQGRELVRGAIVVDRLLERRVAKDLLELSPLLAKHAADDLALDKDREALLPNHTTSPVEHVSEAHAYSTWSSSSSSNRTLSQKCSQL